MKYTGNSPAPSMMQTLYLRMRRTGSRRILLGLCCIVGLHLVMVNLLRSRAPNPQQGYIQYFPSRQWKDTNQDGVKTILLWTKRFGYDYWAMDPKWDFHECPVSACRLTTDRKYEDSADAVLFHARALWNNFMGATMPERRAPHQVYVFHNQEPLPHTFVNLRPFKGVFNWTSTYRLDSDVPGPYSKMVKLTDAWRGWAEEDDVMILKRGNTVGSINSGNHVGDILNQDPNQDPNPISKPNPNPIPDYHSQKTKLMAWTSSNCIDQRRRVRLVNALGEHLTIHRYGSCGNLTLNCDKEFLCDQELGQYRFYLSLENAVCTDYITEKFYLALQRNQIPVVFSDGVNYARHAPPSSYIDAKDFATVKELAEYIQKVDADPALYNSYFWWQHFYKVQPNLHMLLFCNLCSKLHDQATPAQVYTDVHGWYNDDMPECPQFSVSGLASRFLEGNLLQMGLIS